MDYSHLPICGDGYEEQTPSSPWNRGIQALHGDALYTLELDRLNILVGQNTVCSSVCDVTMTWAHRDAISRNFNYNLELAGLPVGYKLQDDYTRTTKYWGGIPVGRGGGSDVETEFNPRYDDTTEEELYVYNHFNFVVYYAKEGSKYVILKATVEPFSVKHLSDTNGVLECDQGADSSSSHVSYDILRDISLQPAKGRVRVTYDVKWIESAGNYKSRWNVYLNMDGAVPDWIEFMGFLLGIIILVGIFGILATWVLRDLSYKPVVTESEYSDDEQHEVEMWPLSTRVFFPPQTAPVLFCIAVGTGAQVLISSLLFLIFMRTGIVSLSLGYKLLTPAAVCFVVSSLVGGYVTGRLHSIFHGGRVVALLSSLITAVAYPLVGTIVVMLVYDVLPDEDTPDHNVMSNNTALLLVWILCCWPLAILGGFLGHRSGPIQNFPVSAGTTGYQDLNLQDEKKEDELEDKRSRWYAFMKRYRITMSLLFGGMLPALACFVSYSYGVVGPIVLGYYPVRSYMIASYCIFLLVSSSLAVLAYYRQIRAQLYAWWWSVFAISASSGLYIFLLSASYIIFRSESHISGNTVALYLLWFAYSSFGVAMMTGAFGVFVTMLFNKTMYTYLTRRQ